MGNFKLIFDDITKQPFDAIINSANSSLLGGGGIDGTIHRSAGYDLLKECKSLEGCRTGSAKITKSYNLASSNIFWIIHMVSPIWRGGEHNEYDILRSAYQKALELCTSYKDVYLNQTIEAFNKQQSRLQEVRSSHLFSELKKSTEEYINKHPIKTIGLPFMVSGVYCLPPKDAACIALEEIKNFLSKHPSIEECTVVCQDQKSYDIFKPNCKDFFSEFKAV
ncbi:macro domain-containing protein [Clostridium paridis]|uniref:Macro domain-containing protein n=1 Tax=Clostridium paridis TaxID=2803863 RepID=A0A937K4B9_9CLOT|nr:macro domain-containing protein [Clostridium paridis]MBL4931378.1 macro domain-containing protein [Clostridium paridis]